MPYNTALVLNAWQFLPAIRHQVIFGILDALPPRHSLTWVNDHDPKPLFYQLDAERPGEFTHTPIDPPQPEYFAVVITRTESPDRIPVV
jgi:uncharacterized protein (DUF2249 family)